MTKDIQEFSNLRDANMSRVQNWMPKGLNEWSLSDWGMATGGELGEAMNVAKKINRHRSAVVGNTTDIAALEKQLAAEMADTAIYLDLWAASEGIDLQAAIAETFNTKSIQMGFPQRIVLPTPKTPAPLSLSELRERCASAKFPSYSLDGELARAFNPSADWVNFGENGSEPIWVSRDPDNNRMFEQARAYTDDVTQALGLLTEEFEIGKLMMYSLGEDWVVEIHSRDPDGASFQAVAATLPYALCCAALDLLLVEANLTYPDNEELSAIDQVDDHIAKLRNALERETARWKLTPHLNTYSVHREPEAGDFLFPDSIRYFPTHAEAEQHLSECRAAFCLAVFERFSETIFQG